MSGWAGFSDDELRRMQQVKDAPVSRGRRAAPAGRSRQQIQREKALQLAAQRSAGAAGAAGGSGGSGGPDLPPEQQLSKPPPPQPPPQPGKDERRPGAEERSPAVKELEKQEVEVREKTRLEQLQQEQQLMEERNKRKKALLAKTIAEKSKQTQAEAVKLKRIQKGLQALDDMVSNDIGILRGRIEQASWDFSTARKRFERAEAEYVTAKLELHKKTEVKEQLTEHLCAIIQQNELRKAHKLEELMLQLQLQPTEEEEQQEEQEEQQQQELKEEKEETSRPQTLRQEEKNEAVEKLEVPSKDCREKLRQEGGGAGQNHAQPKTPPPQVPPPPDSSSLESQSS